MLKLHDFPFDIQELSVILSELEHGSKPNTATDFRLGDAGPDWKFRNSINAAAAGMLPEWELHYPIDQVRSNDASLAGLTQRYELAFLMRRQIKFHAWNIMFPFFGISGLALLCFALPPEEVNDRLTIVFTMLLTAVAF